MRQHCDMKIQFWTNESVPGSNRFKILSFVTITIYKCSLKILLLYTLSNTDSYQPLVFKREMGRRGRDCMVIGVRG